MKRVVLSVVILLVAVVVGCKSAPEPSKPPKEQAPVEREVLEVDRGLELALADNAAVVFKIRLDQVDEVAPALQKLADQTEGAPAEMLEALAAKKWAELFSMLTREDAPATLGIDESAPIYVSLTALGGDRFGEAFAHGASLQPDQALPAALRTRVVVPAADSEALKSAFEYTRLLGSKEGYTLSLRREANYLVADYERLRPDLDSRMKLDDEDVTPRQTPAFEEFAASTDPLAVYMRTREFLAYGAAANQYDMTRAFESVSPSNAFRVLSRGTAVSMNLLRLSPPSQRELEDTCIRLTGDGEQMAMVTALSTQTELGRALAAANEEAVVVPRSFPREVDPFAELRLNFAGDAMSTVAPVDASQRGAGSVRGLARAVRDNGWLGFAGLLFGSPTYVPRLMYQKSQTSEGAALPYAMLLELVPPPESDVVPAMRGGGPFPIYGVAMAFAVEGLEERELGEARDMLEVFPSSGGPKTSSMAIESGTLFRSTNGESLAQDTEDVELTAGRAWGRVELAPMLELMGDATRAEGLAPFDSVTADWSLRDTTNRWLLIAGDAGMIAETVPEMRVEPLAVAPACVGEALRRQSEFFAGFERLRKGKMSPDAWLAVPEKSGVDSTTKACAEAHPEYADSLEIALARTGEFMIRYAELLDKPEVVKALRERGCDLGDDVQCQMLEE